MKSALKIRLYPNTEQQNKLSVQFGCARWVWNNALNFAQNHYQQTGETLSTYDLNARLKPLKIEHQWLKEADSQVLQQSILNFGEARQRFFKKQAHFPKYKAKHKRQSIQYPQRVKFNEEQRSLYLPKIGWVRCVLHRELIGQVKTVTISKTPSGKYYAALCLEDQRAYPEPIQAIERIEAVDLGIYYLLVDSQGNKQTNPKVLKRHEHNLRKKQKQLSAKVKGSKNRQKARQKLAKVHQTIARVRHDFQHKISHQLSSENQAVVVENLNIKGMLKNHRLAKALSDAALSSLIEKLRYKLARKGGHLVVVDRFFPSSKLCSVCNYKHDDLSLSVRQWNCPACGTHHDRDINAAINLKKEGIRLLVLQKCFVRIASGSGDKHLTAAGLTVAACGGLCQTSQEAAA